MKGKFYSVFPALNNSNFQLYFSGQLVSMIGTWLQIVAQGWLVLKLTNSAFLVGLVAGISMIPTLFFSLFGGVIVDKFPKRKILIFTQVSSMILAFILGILTLLNLINVWLVAFLGFLLGVINALDTPARQSFVIEIVGKKDLSSAISLNSGSFNAARIIGPSIAGLLIGLIGTGGAFILNGLSYLAVILALIKMRVESVSHEVHPNPLKAIKEGVAYSFKHPIIKTLLITTAIMSVFGWSYSAIMPVIAQDTFNMDATGLGYLYAATGLGALSAAVSVSAFSRKLGANVFILGGNALFAVAIILFSYTSNLPVALILLFFAGFGLLSMFSMINTTIQNLVEDHYRGRVMALYSVMLMGMLPIGNIEVGFLSQHFGTGLAIRFGAAIVLLFGALIFLNRERIRRSHVIYKKENSGDKESQRSI